MYPLTYPLDKHFRSMFKAHLFLTTLFYDNTATIGCLLFYNLSKAIDKLFGNALYDSAFTFCNKILHKRVCRNFFRKIPRIVNFARNLLVSYKIPVRILRYSINFWKIYLKQFRNLSVFFKGQFYWIKPFGISWWA